MQPHPIYLGVIRAIDGFTSIVCLNGIVLLVAPLILANVVEVIMRYAFRSPTIWALDVTTQSFGAMFMLGSAYALLKGAHIRTDIFWEKFSPRTQGTIDSVAYIFLFIPAMLVLIAVSWQAATYAFSIDERSSSGIWRVVVWPFRFVVPAAAAMLLLQGISELLKSLWAWRTGELLVRHEKIEI